MRREEGEYGRPEDDKGKQVREEGKGGGRGGQAGRGAGSWRRSPCSSAGDPDDLPGSKIKAGGDPLMEKLLQLGLQAPRFCRSPVLFLQLSLLFRW